MASVIFEIAVLVLLAACFLGAIWSTYKGEKK